MYVTDCTQLPDALYDKLYRSIKCNRMLRFIYCRHKPKVQRINKVCFRMSLYPHRIQQFFLVYCTHRKSQYPFSRIKAAKCFRKKVKKFSTPTKIIYVDRPIYNRKKVSVHFPAYRGGEGVNVLRKYFIKFPHCQILPSGSKNFRSVNSSNIACISLFLPCPIHYPWSRTGCLKSKCAINGSRNASAFCDTTSMEINLSGPRIKWFLVKR
jgi:hypothetical protein